MSEVREYKCDYYTVVAPATCCLFCAHCTDIFWDYSGPYAFACDIEADTGIGVSGECTSFLDDECEPQTSCPYCRYEGTDEDASHLNENIYSDDDLIACFLYDGGLSVMPFHDGRQLRTKYVPVNYCPMCGRKL